MKNFSYNAYVDDFENGINKCSRERNDVPLLINCTGVINLSFPFTTYNEKGRADYYLIYILSGELTVDINGAERHAGAGDFIVFPPRRSYWYTFSGDGTISYYFIHFTGSYVDELLGSVGVEPLSYIGSAGFSEEAAQLFRTLFNVYAHNESFRDIKGAALLQQIICVLATLCSGSVRKNRLKNSLSYINAFYTDSISATELARMDNLSVSRYNTVFREITGVSPIKYITALRMNHACTLLDTTDIDIGIIGEMVGYADKHFFSKMFRKHVGVSAKEYRNKK